MTETSHAPQLTHDVLRAAVEGPTAAIRLVTKLLPAGGPLDKIFPPTYAGGVYAIETRKIDGRDVRCVHLDSVQSQANRLEQALLRAYEDAHLRFPVMVVDFSGTDVHDVGRITTLDAPHRIADAIFRDSLLNGVPFRESLEGKAFERASVRHATALFDLCPTALVFGTWDSTGSKGGRGNKFARAVVSEIVAIDVAFGLKTSSRIDPLGIEVCDIFEASDGTWTTDEGIAKKDPKTGSPIKYGRNRKTRGKPSAIIHGNVTPGFATYTDNVDVLDPLKRHLMEALKHDSPGRDMSARDVNIREGQVAAGGVTMAYALQTTVLSLPALRRLRFPVDGGGAGPEREHAARTVLAALALASVAFQSAQGYDLRSRCALVPADNSAAFELVTTGTDLARYSLPPDQAARILDQAANEARRVGLPWRTDEIKLVPSKALVQLVVTSRANAAEGESEGV